MELTEKKLKLMKSQTREEETEMYSAYNSETSDKQAFS